MTSLILGAGLAGLTAGFYSKKKGDNPVILDPAPQPGGVMATVEKDGFLLELGPNTVTPNPALMQLIEDLDLQNRVVLADPKTPRFIHRNNRLHPVPLSPFGLLRTSLLNPWGKIRLAFEPFVAQKTDHDDESLLAFASRRLGAQSAQVLVSPFLSGVWAGDGHHLSAQSAMPKLVQWEREWGSLFQGALSQKKTKPAQPPSPKGLLSFQKGLIQLIQALHQALKDTLHLNQTIQKIEKGKNGEWTVTTPEKSHTASKLILACPAPEAARLLNDIAPAAAASLREIPYAPLVVAHLAVPKNKVGRPLNGFGYLNTPQEKREILGCLWSSSLFPNRAPAGQCLFTVFMGGSLSPKKIQLSDDDLTEQIHQELTQTLKLSEKPRALLMTRLARAIPQYTLGHARREQALKTLEEQNPGLQLIGNYRGGISVGDVIQNATGA